jgi:hypothetical protein
LQGIIETARRTRLFTRKAGVNCGRHPFRPPPQQRQEGRQMNAPTTHSPSKRRDLKKWMASRQRRLFAKNKVMPDAFIAQRINQIGQQITSL